MKSLILLLCLLVIIYSCGGDADSAATTSSDSLEQEKADTSKKFEMKQYWLVFLVKGPNRNQDSISAAKIQEAHMRNIESLAAAGKIVVAGPMGYDKDLRGIFIMDVKDSLTAATYVKSDSAVITGRLGFEIHPLWLAKGKVEFK